MKPDTEALEKNHADSLWHNAERLAILHEIDQSILGARMPETIALAAIGRLKRLVPYHRALVLAVDEEGLLRLLACQSATDGLRSLDPDLYRELLDEPTLADGRIYGLENMSALHARSRLQQALQRAGIRSYVVVPLWSQDGLAGTLNLESTAPRAFTGDQITIAREVATSLAVAIRQARLHARLQKELEERVQAEIALQRRTAALEAHNAELDAFAHTVAHDLKNPVSAIVGYAGVLRTRREALTADMEEHYLHVIAANARKMNTIIDELLLLASVRARGDVKTGPLDMARIVGEAVERLRHLVDEGHAELDIPTSWPLVDGYAPWVEEVWVNYIGNALKYGGQPPHVELGAVTDGQVPWRSAYSPVTIEKRDTDPLWTDAGFWVRDNGPGLTREECASLFTPFERLHQVHGEGHGLGLSIVQRIVQKLGGTVGVHSDGAPGNGCTFYFTLPPGRET
ncbi:MAG TPA: HAMP domain-containing sensor histidine kinase [Anaerolineae bacterium]|nr:HAMP domain-containing sensor histidine kinase [Anaerolineae bacterium]